MITERLKILFVSDIHLSEENIAKLKAYASKKQHKFDYCFVGGDIANCNHQASQHDESAMLKASIDFLQLIQHNFQVKVLFIPGNHDPLTFLNQEFVSHNPNVINIHKKSYLLAEGLTVFGFGGATPAYSDPHGQAQVWSGYPYHSEKQISIDFHANPCTIGHQLLYLTHTGPSASNTTVDRRNASRTVYAGSQTLNDILNDGRVIGVLHGHVHFGGKFDIMNSKKVLNPGALLFGQFMHVALERRESKWRFETITYEQL